MTPSFSTRPTGRFFIKMHGLRNHFVIIDARDEPYRPDENEIMQLCDPAIGIGGDQLLIIESPTNADNASAFMRILNVDGREVEACGNATRCVAWLLMEESGIEAITLQTVAGLIECRKVGHEQVSCAMGKVSMDWRTVPLAEERDTCHVSFEHAPLVDGVALNIGNPHIVFFVNDIESIDIEALAPAIQKDALFPHEVNVGVAEIKSAGHMRLKVFERGAGLTTACGSGACVAVYAARQRGLTDKSKMTVTMPAGDIVIEISADGCAVLSGPVAYCFSGFY
jgi:diaminopimelate epimerase